MCAVHYPDKVGEELSVVYHLHNLVDNIRIRFKVFTDIKKPDVFSATALYSAANWMERETYDFYGVNFIGHPNLKRILNVDEMEYFPLRKEFPLEDQRGPIKTMKCLEDKLLLNKNRNKKQVKMSEHVKLSEGSLEKQTTTLNLGPTHPATHGVFQNIIELDGERIVGATQTVGYIHRAFEKIAEHRPLYQITPLTDRLNYCSSPINNMGWHITCERLLGVKTPKRVDYLRIIIMELARISDHLICNSIVGVDSGAYTGFLYVMQYRELIYEIYEEICGSRLTTNIGRIGGFERNFTNTAFEKLEKFIKEWPVVLAEFDNLFVRNRIFMERTIGVGPYLQSGH